MPKPRKRSTYALRREHIAKVRVVIQAEIVKLEKMYGADAVGSAYTKHVLVRRKRRQLDERKRQVDAEIRALSK